MGNTSKDVSIREFIQLHRATVPYIGQSYSWDCGLACTEMALRARGVKQVRFNVGISGLLLMLFKSAFDSSRNLCSLSQRFSLAV